MYVSDIDDSEYFQMSAFVGDNITLYCNTTHGHVDWKYYNEYLYLNGFTHHRKFTVDRSVAGEYNLVMPNIQLNESGIYACIEKSGQGRLHEYTVNITGRTAACCF